MSASSPKLPPSPIVVTCSSFTKICEEKENLLYTQKNQKLSQNFNTIFKGWDVCFQKTYDLTRILRVNIYCNTQEILMPIKLCWVEIFTKQWKIFVSNLMNYNFKYINSEPLYFFVVSNENLKKKKIKEIIFLKSSIFKLQYSKGLWTSIHHLPWVWDIYKMIELKVASCPKH